jgi:hypothetical protein
MYLPEDARMFRRYRRKVEHDRRNAKPKLFQALEELANIRFDEAAWKHFRQRWPSFFPQEEYERVVQRVKPNIKDYPYWLGQIWIGGETEPYLRILLGLETAPGPQDQGTLEDSWLVGLATVPSQLYADWNEGAFCYEGVCDFHEALYLLFRESWRARVCESCGAKFIARRAAQKYCSPECSGKAQRELNRSWWAVHGETWRRQRNTARSPRKRRKNGPHKAR